MDFLQTQKENEEEQEEVDYGDDDEALLYSGFISTKQMFGGSQRNSKVVEIKNSVGPQVESEDEFLDDFEEWVGGKNEVENDIIARYDSALVKTEVWRRWVDGANGWSLLENNRISQNGEKFECLLVDIMIVW